MQEKPVVIVISDLHLGGGQSDPGDDHVYDQAQLCNFIREKLLNTPEGQRGDLELFINGDFLDFAQTDQEAYRLSSGEAWCSEAESLAKLKVMLDGHADIFEALRQFGEGGNLVTIAAGNHDVDLFWPAVQKGLCDRVGQIQFVLSEEWSSRFQGQLRIAHGHQKDKGNRFKHWDAPFVKGSDGQKRLEMCPGTLFMVKFVNRLENAYPFADNIKPISALAGILGREDKLGALTVAWMLSKFCLTHPQTTLEADASGGRDFASVLVDLIRSNSELGKQFAAWYRTYMDANKPDAAVREDLRNEDTLAALLLQVMRHEPPSAWEEVLDRVPAGHATLGAEEGTLELGLSQIKDEKESFREVAKAELANRTTRIVILGHTHSPDGVPDGVPDGLPLGEGKQYFNPGSWTRYAEVGSQKKLKLEDLRDESKFPYQLNYVRVEMQGTKAVGKMHTFSELQPPK